MLKIDITYDHIKAHYPVGSIITTELLSDEITTLSHRQIYSALTVLLKYKIIKRVGRGHYQVLGISKELPKTFKPPRCRYDAFKAYILSLDYVPNMTQAGKAFGISAGPCAGYYARLANEGIIRRLGYSEYVFVEGEDNSTSCNDDTAQPPQPRATLDALPALYEALEFCHAARLEGEQVVIRWTASSMPTKLHVGAVAMDIATYLNECIKESSNPYDGRDPRWKNRAHADLRVVRSLGLADYP